MTKVLLIFLLILNTICGCHDGKHEDPTPPPEAEAKKKVELPEPTVVVQEVPVLIDQAATPFLVPVGGGGGGRRQRHIRDVDGDSVADAVDNCVEIFNPSQRDFDCDSVGDQCDQCPYGDDRVDENNNQVPDECEVPVATTASLPTEAATVNPEIPVVTSVGDPVDWADYQAAVAGSPGADAPLFENSGELVYNQELHPFNNICDYDHVNASALAEINFNVSRAAGEQNTNLAPPPGFEEAFPISGLNPISNVIEVFAYIFVSDALNMVVLSFTGTETIGQLIADLLFVQVPPLGLDNTRPGMLIELGFSQLYGAVQASIQSTLAPLLNGDKQFVISGHSLGGALTTLAALDLADHHPIVYSFASPRVGNPVFARSYNDIPILSNTWRIFNTEDFVSTLPLPVFPLGIVNPPNYIYEHVGNPVPFTINLGTLLTNHIEAYDQVFMGNIYPDNPNGICPQRYDCSGLTPATSTCAN
jgi:hypothetical protein